MNDNPKPISDAELIGMMQQNQKALREQIAALEAELATVKKVAYGNMELLEENAKLRAELERRAVPDGWKLVPIKPTEAMLKAGDGYIGTPATYKAMLSAAPNAITTEFSQFLKAVMDAAGLVRHGRQSKELSEYLGSQCMKYRLAAAPSAPKADDPVKVQLLEALEFAARSLATMTSADGSGHADIALCVLRMAGYATDERERVVDMWKHDRQWPTDAIAAARKGEGE